jgi:hypothetical protein
MNRFTFVFPDLHRVNAMFINKDECNLKEIAIECYQKAVYPSWIGQIIVIPSLG